MEKARALSRMLRRGWFTVLFISLFPVTVHALAPIDLPTLPILGPVLFDRHPAGSYDLLAGSAGPSGPSIFIPPPVGGPCAFGAAAGVGSGEVCQFVDGAASVDYWRTEQEIYNPNPFIVSFPVGFYFPGGGLPVRGTLTLGPLSAFYIMININDFPELGVWNWWNFNGTPWTLGITAAVVEDRSNLNIPGSYAFTFFSDPADSFVADNSVTPQFGLNNPNDLQYLPEVPEPTTVLTLGRGL